MPRAAADDAELASSSSSPTLGKSRGKCSAGTPQSASTPFFIVQEPVISPSGGVTSQSPTGYRDADAGHVSSDQKKAKAVKSGKKRRSSSGVSSPLSQKSWRGDSQDEAPGAARTSDRTSFKGSSPGITTLDAHKEDEHESDDVAPSERPQRKEKTQLILSRVGSAPDLPLHSSVSAGVYSSSKKRNLMKSAGPNGAGPHLIALQRSRLIPLPINIRTGTLQRDAARKRDEWIGSNNNSSAEITDNRSQQQLEDKANDDFAIASLKVRLAQMEKDMVRVQKHKHALEKQSAQLSTENQSLHAEKLQLHAQIDQMGKSMRQQKHAFEKLSDRYANVYANLQKLTEQQQSPTPDNHIGATQSVLQALTRENQDFQRKLRVLEARHVEDKAIAANQEKKIKRLRAEMEALQHMNNARDDGSESQNEFFALRNFPDMKKPDSSPMPSSINGKPLGAASTKVALSPAAALSSNNTGTSSNRSHLIGAEDYQYIDPNILKVLEKVDSQFSITNAISLSAVLKKWLNSCLHVVNSTNLSSVLQSFLNRVCELLHCKHAALFEVDYLDRKLVGKYSESGDVRWELPLDKGILGYAARQNTLCNVPKAYDDPRFFSSTDTITGIPSREVLCIPLVHELHPRQPHGVFAVLQAWNTTHQKPFTTNDQILGCLLTIQAGTVAKTLQKVNRKLLQIVRMPQEILQEPLMNYTSSSSVGLLSGSSSSVVPTISAVHLVATAQKKFAECIGIHKVKIFVLEPELMKIWYVGSEVDAASGHTTLVRKYSNVLSSLCGLVVKSNSAGIVLEDPVSEAAFNDTVDLKGGAGGMYLYPIGSPWGTTSLGMIQVARSAVRPSSGAARGPASDGDSIFAATVHKEKQSARQSQDSLLIELIELFARMFASLLHHVKAHQLYDTCPQEIQDARLAYITDRLELLESEYTKAQAEAEEEEARIERSLAVTAMMEQRILESAQQERRLHSQEGQRLVTSSLPLYDDENEAVQRARFTDPGHTFAKSLHTARCVSPAGSRKDMPIHRSSMANSLDDDWYLYVLSPSQDINDSPSHGNGHVSTATCNAEPFSSEPAELVTTEPTLPDSREEAGILRSDTDNAPSFLNGEAPDDEQQEVDLAEHEPGEGVRYNDGEAGEDDGWQGSWHQQDPSQDDGNDTIDTTWQEQDEAGDTNDLWHEYEHQDEHNAEEDEEQWQANSVMDVNSWRDASDESRMSDPSPVGLLSTDSMYAIDLSYSDGSPADDEDASP
uniref:GAF domain-containing protein n=1 Tax=Globisporangium ultimum (strain ATCC 200006 / CBS 805.95 / DAOM BR144) TaxID=431595 RepID=K3X7U6_GLOUD